MNAIMLPLLGSAPYPTFRSTAASMDSHKSIFINICISSLLNPV